MANIYPQFIPGTERAENPGRRAEYLVYDVLAEQLGDEWLVLYGHAIKWSHQHGVSDREADFIVAHPKLGVVVVEVKGGSISREGGLWYSTPLSQFGKPVGQQKRHDIKNPYDQATNAAYAYERKLDDAVRNQPRNQRPSLSPRTFKIGTAVCFPDVDIPPGLPLSGNALPELTLSQQDMPRLKDRLYEILKLYQGQTGQPPGEAGLALLKAVLARDWHIPASLANQFNVIEQQQKKLLTEEQFRLYTAFDYNPKMLVAGCAGSGKTMLAVQRALNLAQQGEQVLFTCFNRQLATWLSDYLRGHEHLTIGNFHDICRRYADQAEAVDLPQTWSAELGISQQTYYNETMPEALALAALELELGFDAIIVDEGQDFRSSWLQTLHDHLLKDDPESGFYIFYDDNQRVYGKRRSIPFQWPIHPLTRNMRNTEAIFKLFKTYHHQPHKVLSSGIAGQEPQIVPIVRHDEYQTLQTTLSELINAQQVPAKNIVVLTPLPRSQSLWNQTKPSRRDCELVWHPSHSPYQVRCSTIRTFKGLESQVVILTELDGIKPHEIQDLLYVGISRAKHHLVILGNLPQPDQDKEEEYYY